MNLSFFMGAIYLQSFYCKKNLSNLVCFGVPLIILNIYSWIALPRGFINSMTAPSLARFAEIMVAHSA
ncbi:protein of unknown function [Candidatus Methylomirabilis oxygeniifera]|uniref:Uncharacterized protein n=1 Tax=Methylomirabilis oxygeniifera TaxID=671143 RepID=D5MF84_METO1|nr:protein of unknown function [Candidatus Methylomirabilis oxyfera]